MRRALVEAHIAAAESLAESVDEPGARRLWSGEAGEVAGEDAGVAEHERRHLAAQGAELAACYAPWFDMTPAGLDEGWLALEGRRRRK